ncbi:hypothetical protein I3842_Q111600 [Carya illinoinensis]|uniref:Uncharacterized protein n=1 Tax=Carya illinoinensis TaxID=32201 RepID=A0A922D6M2_CARIL|nr:hypothetical protein I3842_Q111600 [Carya illinoinensis]
MMMMHVVVLELIEGFGRTMNKKTTNQDHHSQRILLHLLCTYRMQTMQAVPPLHVPHASHEAPSIQPRCHANSAAAPLLHCRVLNQSAPISFVVSEM